MYNCTYYPSEKKYILLYLKYIAFLNIAKPKIVLFLNILNISVILLPIFTIQLLTHFKITVYLLSIFSKNKLKIKFKNVYLFALY